MTTLHGFSQSGNTYKVALLLQALQLPWTARHVPLADFAAGLTRSEPWRQSENEMGEVPILEVDGKRLTQSAAILLYLAQRHGQYGGANADEHQDVLRWLFFDNHKFTSYFATYRFMKSFARVANPTRPSPSGLAQGPRSRTPSASSRSISPAGNTSLAMRPPSPTSRWRATSSSRSRRAASMSRCSTRRSRPGASG